MARPIKGLIVAYNGGKGVLLLQRPSGPTIEQMAKRYAHSQDDQGFWFARFEWSDIAESHRESVQRRSKSVRKSLLGSRVICTVAKNPTWRALWVSLDFDHVKLQLPERRVHPERYRPEKAGDNKTESPERKWRAAPQSNNVRHPWGGMGQ
jgi:hypothetical protein